MPEQKVTVAQKRILDILSDGKPHKLIPELENAGYWNQHPAIGALERKHLIEEFYWNGYYTEWRIVRTNPLDKEEGA